MPCLQSLFPLIPVSLLIHCLFSLRIFLVNNSCFNFSFSCLFVPVFLYRADRCLVMLYLQWHFPLLSSSLLIHFPAVSRLFPLSSLITVSTQFFPRLCYPVFPYQCSTFNDTFHSCTIRCLFTFHFFLVCFPFVTNYWVHLLPCLCVLFLYIIFTCLFSIFNDAFHSFPIRCSFTFHLSLVCFFFVTNYASFPWLFASRVFSSCIRYLFSIFNYFFHFLSIRCLCKFNLFLVCFFFASNYCANSSLPSLIICL